LVCRFQPIAWNSGRLACPHPDLSLKQNDINELKNNNTAEGSFAEMAKDLSAPPPKS